MAEQIIVRELTFNDEDGAGVTCISIVDEPAIMADFVALSAKEQNTPIIPVKMAAVQDGERRMLYGPALIPDLRIQRGVNFYITFSASTIQKAAHGYLRAGMQGSTNLQHSEPLDGVTVVESWLKEFDADKSNGFGFNHPIGTWFVGMECRNDKVWDDVKAGTFKGFSIEAGFTASTDKVMNSEDAAIDEIQSMLK